MDNTKHPVLTAIDTLSTREVGRLKQAQTTPHRRYISQMEGRSSSAMIGPSVVAGRAERTNWSPINNSSGINGSPDLAGCRIAAAVPPTNTIRMSIQREGGPQRALDEAGAQTTRNNTAMKNQTKKISNHMDTNGRR